MSWKTPGEVRGFGWVDKAQCFRSARRFGDTGSSPDFSRGFSRHGAPRPLSWTFFQCTQLSYPGQPSYSNPNCLNFLKDAYKVHQAFCLLTDTFKQLIQTNPQPYWYKNKHQDPCKWDHVGNVKGLTILRRAVCITWRYQKFNGSQFACHPALPIEWLAWW